jgi:hypothetical protein
VNYGYDLHSIEISPDDYASIAEGKAVMVEGQGFRWEGMPALDTWSFNEHGRGSLYISTEDGGVIFDGDLFSGQVSVDESTPR